MKLPSMLKSTLAILTLCSALLQTAHSQPAEAPPGPAPDQASPTLPQADPAKEFKLPGLVVNRKENCVDLDATVCLKRGALELVACTKGSKEHESIVAVDAKPIHIHTALLLLRVQPGNPAMREPTDEEGMRWIDIPPRGGPVDVFLVVKDKEGKTVERPISDFITRSDHGAQGMPAAAEGDQDADRFPTHTFLFAGSILHGDGDGPRRYLCDQSGNVISIATFGDEVLCLPEVHSADNGALMWSIDPTHLPDVNSKVILRLRPKVIAADKGDTKTPAAPVQQPAPQVSEQPQAGYFPLAGENASADIFVSGDDWQVARIAAGDLALDIERVIGRRPALKHETAGLSSSAVLVGTIGKSRIIDDLIKAGRLDVADIAGQWESFVIATVADPLPGVARGLVIVGSDRRGTAYGVYEMSRRIGVSPWYWWADVTPLRRAALHVSPERVRTGPPAVKYRGIFINDEMWGIRPWAEKNFAPDEGMGLGPKTYARIFELLLRLRANYIWPAMHVNTIPFNTYPENKVVADNYAIVMGSSHIEPMLRNNIANAEWDREGGGEWDYQKNPGPIRDYWARRLVANGRYENIYTLGMRGKDDEPMKFEGTKEDKIALMEQIFADQRQLLAKHVNPDPTKVPQVFIPYTEVLGLYDSGMKVPDDVIICWPDDNFGYIRRLPTAAERTRPGGSGIYYHIQWLNGATTAYTWLNTTPPALIWQQMHMAWEYGANQLWVLNVGDIKPGEIGTEFFLDMACDPERYRHDNVRDFLVQWAARDIDPRFAGEIASIMEEYYRLGHTRRPEHLVQVNRKTPLAYSWFSHTWSNDEAMQRLEQYDAIARRAQAVYEQLPTSRKDAFFQLVLYPVQCSRLINRKVIFADKSTRADQKGWASAHEHAAKAREAADQIIELTKHYNTELITAGAKWNHIISPAPGPWGTQFRQFEMPPLSAFAGEGPPRLDVFTEGGLPDAVADLSVFTQGRRFIDLENKGKGALEWKAAVSQPWLKLDRTEGSFTTNQRLWVTVNWAAAPSGEAIEAAIDLTSNGGKRRITVPVFNPATPKPSEIAGFVESHGCVSMEAEHFTRRRAASGACWDVIAGLGRSGDSVTVLPSNIASVTDPAAMRSKSPTLEYDMHLFHTGEFQLCIDCLPTHPVAPDRGVRLAISLNGGEPRIVGGPGRQPPGDVLANLRRWTTTLAIDRPGRHTLTVWMVDPGVVIDKIVLHTGPPCDSYLGPPESAKR